MHGHGHGHHHGPTTRGYRRETNRARPGLWPLMIYAGLAIAFAISMVADDHGDAIKDIVLMLTWVIAWVMIPGSLLMILISATDNHPEKGRDTKGVVMFLIVLAISLVITFFVAGPLRVW